MKPIVDGFFMGVVIFLLCNIIIKLEEVSGVVKAVAEICHKEEK